MLPEDSRFFLFKGQVHTYVVKEMKHTCGLAFRKTILRQDEIENVIGQWPFAWGGNFRDMCKACVTAFNKGSSELEKKAIFENKKNGTEKGQTWECYFIEQLP